MLLGVLDQSLSETLRPMCPADEQRAQECVGPVELYTNDADRRGRRADVEEVLHMVIREIGRWKRCALQESNDVRTTRRRMNCRRGLHGYATFLRLTVFDAEAGLHAVAHELPLAAQQFSVR